MFSLQIPHNAQNRPFPSSCLPSLQRESKCDVFAMVISSTVDTNFHVKNFALILALEAGMNVLGNNKLQNRPYSR